MHFTLIIIKEKHSDVKIYSIMRAMIKHYTNGHHHRIYHRICYDMRGERALCYTREFVSKMKFVFIFNVCIFRVHLFFESVAKAAQHIL